jgi:hypothetical protein
MKLKKLFCALLSLLLIVSLCLFAAGCNDTVEDDEPTVDYSLSNIRSTVGSYIVIRSDNASQMIKDAIIDLRTGINEALGVKPDVSVDWNENKKSEYEIVIGETERPESAEAMSSLSDEKPYDIVQIGTKICIVGRDDYAVRRAVYEFLSLHIGAELPESEHHNVRDFGAEGDGVHDDTEAFLKAVAAAEEDGLPVYVPAGTYSISDTVELNEVTLYGYHSGPWTADACDLPGIIQTNPEAPVFHVISGSLSGLQIDVKGVTKDLKLDDAAETVRLSCTGARVSNLKILNPHIGISTFYDPDASTNPGRCFIENIFIVNAYKIGVNVHATWDVATLCNIEVWNPYTSGTNKNSCEVAYKFGKNDDLRAVNLFTFNAKVGFLFEESDIGNGKTGGCWGSFTNCSTDLCETGLKVDKGQHALTIIGGTYWNHFYGLYVTEKTSDTTRVTLSGCELKTNGDTSTVAIGGGQMVTVTGCNISRTQADHKGIPVKIAGGTGVTLSGNTICANGTAGIDITSGFKGAATVTGNTVITSSSTASGAISGKAVEGRVVIESNAVITNYQFD